LLSSLRKTTNIFFSYIQTRCHNIPIVVCEELDRVDCSLTCERHKMDLGSLASCLRRVRICAGKKDAQEEVAVIEIGAAPSRNLQGRTPSFGATVAVEVSPIENWLELEAGVHAQLWAQYYGMGNRPFIQNIRSVLHSVVTHTTSWVRPRVPLHRIVFPNSTAKRLASVSRDSFTLP